MKFFLTMKEFRYVLTKYLQYNIHSICCLNRKQQPDIVMHGSHNWFAFVIKYHLLFYKAINIVIINETVLRL